LIDQLEKTQKSSKLQKLLLLTIALIGIAIGVANLYGQEVATAVSLSIYVPVTVSLVVLSVIISKRFGIKGAHGKAWILFLIFAITWFAAERITLYNNLVLGEEPFPSEADAFWLAGYPFLFVFMIFYLKPLKNAIAKKMILFAIAISMSLLTLSLYIISLGEVDFSSLEFVVGLSYPIADTIVLIPAIIGLTLFFGGKVNFLWSLMCIGIVIEAIADTGFLLASIDDTYYEGHPVDILFNWYYAIFSFGVYHHITVFKDHRKDPYKNVQELR
jgi:hypothetical protein